MPTGAPSSVLLPKSKTAGGEQQQQQQQQQTKNALKAHPLEMHLAAQREAELTAGPRAADRAAGGNQVKQQQNQQLRRGPAPAVVGAVDPAVAARRALDLAAMRDAAWMPVQLRACAGGDGVLGVHEAIRAGRDEYIEWEDVFADDPFGNMPDFHTQMERRLQINR